MNRNRPTKDAGRSRRSFLSMGLRAAPLLLLPPYLRANTTVPLMVRRTAFAMGTTVSIRAYGEDREMLQHAITRSFALLHRYDRLFSTFLPDSDISRINRASGKAPAGVAMEVTDILSRARTFSSITGGRFDCTVEPLKRLWGFYDRRETPPSDREIARTLESVGDRFVHIDPLRNEAGLLRSGAAIDLGGIAVGYTVDAMAAILREEGVTSALIDHSGDVLAIGAPPDAQAWQIGIPHPLDRQEMIATLNINDQALSTSGSYNSFVEYQGQPYGHILDLRTGTPSSALLSVTVIAPSCLASDVLSTALFSDSSVTFKSDKLGTKLEIVSIDSNMNYSHMKCQ